MNACHFSFLKSAPKPLNFFRMNRYTCTSRGPNILKRAIFQNAFLLSVFFSFLPACSQYQVLDPEVMYKRDISLEVNGKVFLGVTTIPYAKAYDITIIPPGEIDLAIMRTCHRAYTIEKADSGWSLFGNKKKKFTYHCEPIAGLEDNRICPLKIEVYESAKGRNSWALVEMENPMYTVKAEMFCDGEKKIINGVGACQARKDSIQQIKFDEPIRFAPAAPGCNPPYKREGLYELKLSEGECPYVFDTKDGRLGRVTFIGFKGVLVREAQ